MAGHLRLMRSVAAGILSFCVLSCGIWKENESEKGELRLRFGDDFMRQYRELVPENLTRGFSETVPHPNDFILEVTGPDDEVLYSGKFGDSPETLIVDAGTYNLSVMSCRFSKPAFASPQLGDIQCVVVQAGSSVEVEFECSQLNCGIRLLTDSGFLDTYPDASLFVKSDEGKLLYSYNEDRIAYFNPGKISVIMSSGPEDKTLFTKTLKQQQILSVKINTGSASHGTPTNSMSIQVDTSRVWLEESLKIGSEGNTGKGDYDDALTVAQAKEYIGEESVWVYGYIVGGDMTSSATGISFEAPFSSATHIAIADRTSASSKSSCLSVQLSSGELRDVLNLRDNPDNIGRLVYLKGNIVEAYYGIPGLKSITEYILE